MRVQIDHKTFFNVYLAYPESPPQSSPAQSSFLDSPAQLSGLSSTHSTPQSSVAPSPPPSSIAQSPLLPFATESLPSTALHTPQSASSPSHAPPSHVDHMHLSLPQIILEEVVNEGMYQNGVWVGLPARHNSDISESNMYKVLIGYMEIIALLTKNHYSHTKKIPGKWIDTSSKAPQSSSEGTISALKPDFIFAPDETSAEEVRAVSPSYSYFIFNVNCR